MATKIKVILDRSGSMNAVRDVTVDKFNEYLNGVKVDRGKKKILVSLYQFDDQYQMDYEDVPVQDVQPLVAGVSYVPRGATALLDAIGKTMSGDKGRLKSKDKGICVIITDGYENASKEYSNDAVKTLIKNLEDEEGWTFVYLGANQDAFDVAQRFGIRAAGQTISYGATHAGTATAMSSLASATTRYVHSAPSKGMRANSSTQPDVFFTEEERHEAEKTKSASPS